MSEEKLNASLDAESAKPLEEGAAEDIELTDEELENVAGGFVRRETTGSWFSQVNIFLQLMILVPLVSCQPKVTATVGLLYLQSPSRAP